MADDARLYPQSYKRAMAVREQTFLAASHAGLYKSSFSPTENNVLADYIAAECTFDNYARIALATWPDLVSAGGTNYLIFSVLCVWIWHNTGPGLGNDVGGMFVVCNDGTIGPVVNFGTAIPMSVEDAAVIKTPAELISSNPLS